MPPVDGPRAGVAKPPPTGTLLLKDISHLATQHDDLGEIADAAVFVRGNVIEWVGKMAELPAELATADEELSMKGCVVMPGMINTHAHMFQALNRCVAQDKQLYGWLKACYLIWAHMTGDMVYTSTLVCMAEMILTGATCSSDHLYIYPNDVCLDDTIRASRDIGMRFHPVRGGMSAGVSKGGIAPDAVVEHEPDILLDMERCIKEFHDNSRYSMLRMNLGPASQKTVTNELMSSSAQLARKYEGVRLHTHLAENQEDIDYTNKLYGYRFGQYIKTVGWDQGDCWFAHCCMLNEEEQDFFAANKIGIAHCPSSNTRLASGIAPIRHMVDVGVNVGLGVDGPSSSDCQNMLAEARLAMLLQRANGNPKGLGAREALKIATRGGAFNLGRDDIGQIAPGFAADIVAWKTAGNLAFAGSGPDPVAALLLCAPSAGYVHLSIINGVVVAKEGKLLTIDTASLVKDAEAATEELCKYITQEALGKQ